MDGIFRTDSTFMHRGANDLTIRQRASKWAYLAGWQRVGIRFAVLLILLCAARARFAHDAAYYAPLCVAVLSVLSVFGFRARRFILSWSHNRHIVYPLWFTLAGLTGYPLHEPRYKAVPGLMTGFGGGTRENPYKFLTVPRNYADDKAIVKFTIPYGWEGTIAQQKAVTQAIARKLGGDWSATWSMNTSPRFVGMCHAPSPPRMVAFKDFTKYIDESAASVLCLGLGASNALASINLDSESPHIALSMGTGGGKTDTVALIITALVRNMCERIDVIDPKRVSHNWARGLPGVHIHRYITAQMEAIHNVRLLMDSRYDAMDVNDEIVFNRHVVIIEEQNSFIEELKQYWDDYRRELDPKERSRVPRINPAITDLRYILNKGRQCRINVISIYQRMSAAAAGGGDARENYGAKILARHSPQTWKILVGTSPIPRPSRIPGRGILVIGDEHHEIQRAYAGIAKPDGSADKAAIARLRAYALNGRPENTEPEPPRDPNKPRLVSVPNTPAELISLREACDTNVIPMRYQTARKARLRDPEFPPGISAHGAMVYEPAVLKRWHENRPRANRARVA
jgi:hypothetical protein